VVPGLLQTDEYAHAVIEAGAEVLDPQIAQRRIALRMARQRVLTRELPPRLCVVLDEAVLYREIGGRAVLRRQLQRLLDAGRRPGVDVLVLPFSAGSHAALTETFVIFEFPGERRPLVVHSEDLVGGRLRTRPAEVRVYRDAFADLRRRALDVAESGAFIARSGARLR
jgi:hypothetical protein